MLFSSGIFLVYFLPIYILGYLIIPEKFKNAYLLLLSIFFYWWGAPVFSIIVLVSSSINFLIAQKIPASANKRKLLFVYVILNLGLLAYFKYSNFFVENVNAFLLSLGYQSIAWTKVILPIGISFFTFQSITYGVDVYRNDAKPQGNILNYWLYILFFPQLIAGPIVTYSSIEKQLRNRETNATKMLDGLFRFSIGLGKKVLIGNVMAEFGSELTNYSTDLGGSSLLSWLIALCYTFEIYFDFSGYSDMAIGLGKMVGFDFPENFDRPYLSKSITEFWRRWHMTLGNFMKNYLYIPLGGNQYSKNRTFLNLAIVFTLSGLWHGASWNFVVWGLFHGFWLIFERINPFKASNKFKPILMLSTFFIVLNGWVLFDATSLSEAITNFKSMYGFENFNYWIHKNARYYEFHLLFAVVICLLGYFKYFNSIYHFSFGSKSTNLTQTSLALFGVILLFGLSLSHIVSGSYNPFIYFQF
jgi:alginate O-acetyltransferase complex protein AlgI